MYRIPTPLYGPLFNIQYLFWSILLLYFFPLILTKRTIPWVITVLVPIASGKNVGTFTQDSSLDSSEDVLEIESYSGSTSTFSIFLFTLTLDSSLDSSEGFL